MLNAMKLHILVLLCMFSGRLLGIPVLATSRPLVINFPSEAIGASGSIWCLHEDENGTLYAGADKLLVFDGAKWTQAAIENSRQIRSIAKRGNRIWVGGINEVGYFEPDPQGVLRYHSQIGRIPLESINLVLHTFALEKQTVFVTADRVIALPVAGGEPLIWDLPGDSTRRLMAQQTSRGILVQQRLSEGTQLWLLRDGDKPDLEPYPTADDTVQARRPGLFIESDNKWIFPRSADTWVEKKLDSPSERVLVTDPELQKAGFYCMEHSNGVTYIGTFYGGVFIVDRDGNRMRVSKSEGLVSSKCVAIARSRTRGVWVGTDEGLSFIHDIDAASFIPFGATVLSILGDAKRLDVSTAQSTFRLTSEKREVLFELPGLELTRVGDQLVGTRFGQVYKLPPLDGVTPWLELPNQVWMLVAGRKYPQYVYGVGGRTVVRRDVNTGEQIEKEFRENITRLVEDAEGNIWVGMHGGGVIVYDAALEKAKRERPGRQATHLGLHQNQPVVIVEKGGWFIGDRMVDKTLGLSGAQASSDPDGPGWAWALVNDELTVGQIVEVNGGRTWDRKSIPGLSNFKRINAIHRAGEHLFIGGDAGVLQLKIAALRKADAAAPEVQQLRIRGTKSKTSRSASGDLRQLEFESHEDEISVFVRNRFFGAEAPPVWESRLLPLQEEWTPGEKGKPRILANLRPGNYTLELRSIHLGEIGRTRTLKFAIPPPWYASQMGITSFALIATIAFYGAVKFRTRHIEWKNRQLEEKIQVRTHELARANAAKSEFLAAMSHEIRNPMNGVVGIVKMLQESNMGAREKYLLTTLHRCAEQLRTTVDDVLDFSKIEAGEVTLHLDTFDLAEAVNSTISAVDVTGERLELSTWAGARPTVRGDQGKLAQILTNYLSNALKYGQPQRATVDVFVLDEGESRCRVTIAVKNSGPDIPPEELSKLFERFQRGEYAKIRRIGGNGLGLSICKKFAEAMGGSVGASSSGGITVFQLTMPFDKVEAATHVAAEAVPKKLGARALAIEDEDYNRLVLGGILTKMGYAVDWAGDGKTALQLAEQNGYDLILTDWMLPDTDGGTLTKQILEISEEPKPPVFAITAYSTKEKQEECLRAGMAGFISKPITLEKLEAALKGWGTDRVSRLSFDREAPTAAISLEQLGRLGPLEFILPDFTKKLKSDWDGIAQMIGSNPVQAANATHKLVSATLLIEAQNLSEQLRLFEDLLRKPGSPAEVEKLREICAEEVEAVVRALRSSLKRRQQRLSEAQRPS